MEKETRYFVLQPTELFWDTGTERAGQRTQRYKLLCVVTMIQNLYPRNQENTLTSDR